MPLRSERQMVVRMAVLTSTVGGVYRVKMRNGVEVSEVRN